MKQLVIVFLIATSAAAGAAPAAAQGGYLGIYSDQQGTCCVLEEALFAVNIVYIVHSIAPEAKAVRFRVQNNWVNATFVGSTVYSEPNLGDLFSDITVSYGGCEPLPFLVASMNFFPTSVTPTNENLMQVMPAIGRSNIDVTLCDDTVVPGGSGPLYINIDYTPLGCDGCLSVSTEQSTWSGVKSLYR